MIKYYLEYLGDVFVTAIGASILFFVITLLISGCNYCDKHPNAVVCKIGGGNGSSSGGGPSPTPTATPGPTRMTLQELRARQKYYADRMVLHPSEKGESRLVKNIASGGSATLSQLPVDYWSSSSAFRLAKRGDAGADAWFCEWLKKRNSDWFNYPSGSQNHQWAQALGPYAAVKILGLARAQQCGGTLATNAVKTMRDLVSGTWTCCGGGGHESWNGEITGSRHYQQRTWSYQWAVADLGEEPEASIAATNLDKAVAFLYGKVMKNGIWPEDTIKPVRPERDSLCWDWPDSQIKAKYTKPPYNLRDAGHPANTVYVSFILFPEVDFNPDFQGHYATGKCDERAENNNVAYLLGGDRWRPIKGGGTQGIMDDPMTDKYLKKLSLEGAAQKD